MTCKTYKEMYEEVKPFVESEEDFKSLFDSVKNMDYAERADMYMENKLNVADGINAAKPWLDNQRIEVVSIGKKGDKYELDYKYLKSDKVYRKTVGEYRLSMGEEGKTFDVLVKDLDTLYSDMEFVNEGRVSYDKTVIDMINDSGKIVDLAEELVVLDKIKARNEKDLLGKVKQLSKYLQEQVPEVVVHLNRAAESNHGWIPASGEDKVEIYTSVGPGNVNKSALEVYAHELYHGVTRYAVESRDPVLGNVMSQLKKLRLQFLEQVTEDMLAEHMEDKLIGKEQAKKLLDYLADEKVGLHEFVAYAMTNHAVIETMKSMKLEKKVEEHPDFAAKIASWIGKMLDMVAKVIKRTPKDANAYTQMAGLVDSLAKANNRQLEFKRQSVLEKAVGLLDKGDEKLAGYVKKLEEKYADQPLPVKSKKKGFLSDSAYLLKMAARGMVDENAKRVMELTAGFAGLKPEGTAQTILRDMSKGDGYQDLVERMGLMSQNIDQHREFTFTQVALSVKNGFKELLTDAESAGLTDVVLDADLSSVWGDYDIKKLLKDKIALNKAVKDLDEKLKSAVSEKDYRYYREQYRGLGRFMATGVASTIQLLNARNITEKLNHPTDRKLEIDESVVGMIDQLASLEALKHTSEDSKKAVAELMEKDKDGVDNLAAYQSAHKTQSEDKLFTTDADKRKIIKGYSKEIYEKDLDMRIMPAADEAKMKTQGYVKVENLGKHFRDGNVTEMAMYISDGKVVQNLHRVTMRYTDKGRRGTTLRDSYAIAGAEFVDKRAKRDVTKLNLDVAKKILEIEKGSENVLSEADYGMAPVLDNKGEVVDYRYMMSKQKKIDVLKMDRRAVNIIGRMYASSYDKEKTEIFNDEVMKIIDEDNKKNYIEGSNLGRNSKEYIRIEKNSTSDEVRDLWSVMPDNVKSRYEDGFPIRRDIMHSMLGYREMSVVDLPGMKYLPDSAKYGLRVAERLWKDMIKFLKLDIVLKTPTVLIGNTISNFMYSVTSGEMPHKIAALQIQGIKELNEYLSKTKEVIRLENRIVAGRGQAGDERRLSALKNDLNTSSVKDLIDEGFYMSIIEELGLEEFGTNNNKLEKVIDDRLKWLPSIVKEGIDQAYISDKTSLFKLLNMTTQYSDFVARYAQYHLMIKKGTDKATAVKTVRDAYINYNKPNSKFVEWLNQMGFVMFTKYFTRVQRAIRTSAETHPLRVLLAIVGQELLFGDVDDIHDQSVFTKNIGSLFYNPLDNLIGAMTPHGAEAVLQVMSGINPIADK